MVAGFTDLLAAKYKGKLQPEADEYIKFIIDGAKRMHALVNDLLEYARVGKYGAIFVEVDCDKVLVDVLSTLRLATNEASAVISHDTLPTIIAEPFQMAQIFQNLIGNALKFKAKRTPAIHIGFRSEPEHWLFFVRDNGIGIKEEHRERIFLIFQRLHARTEYAGTGIGLAICKKIAEQHKGKIWVESTVGEGTTFFFTVHKGLQLKEVTTH